MFPSSPNSAPGIRPYLIPAYMHQIKTGILEITVEINYIVAFLETNIRSYSENGYCAGGYLVWIGGQRKSGRCDNPFVWKTLNGIEVPFNYTNWGPGEPNCDSGETCVHMSCPDNAWNDFRCHFSSFPLCEI